MAVRGMLKSKCIKDYYIKSLNIIIIKGKEVVYLGRSRGKVHLAEEMNNLGWLRFSVKLKDYEEHFKNMGEENEN